MKARCGMELTIKDLPATPRYRRVRLTSGDWTQDIFWPTGADVSAARDAQTGMPIAPDFVEAMVARASLDAFRADLALVEPEGA